MYKLIIVDDERIVRKGLCDYIEWKKLGFEVVNSFGSGREAIDYIKKNKVDVILSDIEMPDISGVELAKYIFDNDLITKTVLISGHKEFEYAKKAIEFNVINYLLKPIDVEEIKSVFSSLKDTLDMELEKQQELHSEIQSYKELLPIVQQQFFEDILMGAYSTKGQIDKKIEVLRINLDTQNSKICIINVDIRDYEEFLNSKWQYGKEGLREALINFMSFEDNELNLIIVFQRVNEFKIIATSNESIKVDLFKDVVHKSIFEIKDSIKMLLGLEMNFSNIAFFENIYQLAQAQQKNTKTISNEQFCLEVIDIKTQEMDYNRIQKHYKQLISKINEGNSEEVENLINIFVNEIAELPVSYIHKVCIDLFALLNNNHMISGIDHYVLNNSTTNYHRIFEINSIEKIKEFITNEILCIIDNIKEYNQKSYSEVINKAKQYIHNNYNKDLSREDVAERVFLNPSYFSRLFKQKTGETFSEYIIKVKMEKALELMDECKYRISEISERVGYGNCKYFSKVFKKYTGSTPIEYIRNTLKVSGEYE